MIVKARQKMIRIAIILFFLYTPIGASANESTLSIEPSKKSYTTIRYQVGVELSNSWTQVKDVTDPIVVTIKDKNSNLYVQESKDGVKWTSITPFVFDEDSSSWKNEKKIRFTSEMEKALSLESSTIKLSQEDENLKTVWNVDKDKNATATVTINGKEPTKMGPGVDSIPIELEVGVNKIKVIVTEQGKIAQEYTFSIRRKGQTPIAPVITPSSEVIVSNTPITMSSSENAVIYYTTDGSDPKSSLTKIEYTSPFIYEGGEDITLKAIALKDNSNDSKESFAYYSQAISRLQSLSFNTALTDYSFDPETFTYTDLSIENDVASMIVTPTSSSGTITINDKSESTPIPLTVGMNTLKVVAREEGKKSQEYTYYITRKDQTPFTPVILPKEDVLLKGTEITITSSGADAIYYTIDGEVPTKNSFKYESPFVYNGPEEITLRAIAVKEGANDSQMSEESYSQAVSRLESLSFDNSLTDYTFDPETFTYTGFIVEHDVTSLSVTPTSSSVAVTVNGKEASTPTLLAVGLNTITVVAREEGKVPQEYVYIVTRKGETPAAPSFIPLPGAIASKTPIIITSSDGADIYYTTDGTDPTQASHLYDEETPFIYLEPDEINVKAIAIKEGANDSEVSSAHYSQAVSRLEALSFNNESTGYTLESETFLYDDLLVEHDISSIVITPSAFSFVEVQGSIEGENSTYITPYTYEEKSGSWKGEKIIYYNPPTDMVEPVAVSAEPTDIIVEEDSITSDVAAEVETVIEDVEELPLKKSISYFTIEPSKKSYTTVRYQVGESLGEEWTLLTEQGIAIEDTSSITLFVQESKDGEKWTHITPYLYDKESGSWKGQNKIRYVPTNIVEPAIEVDIIDSLLASDDAVELAPVSDDGLESTPDEQPLEKSISYFTIEPSKKFYTTVRYQVGESLGEEWTLLTEQGIAIEDTSSITLFVQESKDGEKWTHITPYLFDQESQTWKAQKKIIYSPPTEVVELVAVIDDATKPIAESEEPIEIIVEELALEEKSIEPIEDSYSLVSEELVIPTSDGIIIKERGNTKVYVEELGEGEAWTTVTPYLYDQESGSWKAQKQIRYSTMPETDEAETAQLITSLPITQVDPVIQDEKRKGLYLSSIDIMGSYQIPMSYYARYQKMSFGAGLQLNIGIENNSVLSLISAFDYQAGISNNNWVDLFHTFSTLFGFSFSSPTSEKLEISTQLLYGPVLHLLNNNSGVADTLYVDQMFKFSMPIVYKISEKIGFKLVPYGAVLFEKNEMGFNAGVQAGINILR